MELLSMKVVFLSVCILTIKEMVIEGVKIFLNTDIVTTVFERAVLLLHLLDVPGVMSQWLPCSGIMVVSPMDDSYKERTANTAGELLVNIQN